MRDVMGRKYANPPLIEALCEFQFAPNTEWPLTNHGEIFERLKQHYPKVRNAQNIRLNASIGPGGLSHQASTKDKTMLYSEDEKSLVQVAPFSLAVNRLKPYNSWNSFLPQIREAFEAYNDVCKPDTIQQVSTRYINQIEFESDRVALEKYFEFRPSLGSSFPKDMSAFSQSAQFLYEDGRDIAVVQLSSVLVPRSAALLDLEYGLLQPERVAVSDSLAWVEASHAHIESLFEACITDTLRQQFGVTA